MEGKRNPKLLIASFTIFAVALIGSANATGSLHFDINVAIHNSAVQNLCNQAEYKDLCVNSIAPLFDGKTDTMSLLEILITSAEESTKKALDLVVQLKAKAELKDSFDQDRLKTCKKKYEDALVELKGSIHAINKKDLSTCATQLSASITYFCDCGDGFEGEIGEEIHPERDPLRQVNENLKNMVGNCLSVSNVLMKSS